MIPYIFELDAGDSGGRLGLPLSQALPVAGDALLKFHGFVFVLGDDALCHLPHLHRTYLSGVMRTLTSSFSASSRKSRSNLTSLALPAFYSTTRETLVSAFLYSFLTDRNILRLCSSLSVRSSMILDLWSRL